VWVAGTPGYSETTQTDGGWTVHNHPTDPWSSEKKAPNSVNLRDLGSVTNVMEEPVVELPLLTSPAGMGRALSVDPEAVSHKLQAW